MLKLRYDLSIWESAMFGGGDDDPALNFDGTSIYGVFTHPITLPGDFEIVWVSNTTSTANQIPFGDDYLTTIYCNVNAGGNFISFWLGGTSYTFTIFNMDDGLDHTVRMVLTGTDLECFYDGVSKGIRTVVPYTGASMLYIGRARTVASYFDGQIKSIKCIDKSGPSDVIQTYQINSGPPVYEKGAEVIPSTTFNDWTDSSVPDGWTKEGTHDANNYLAEAVGGGMRLVSDGTYIGVRYPVTEGQAYVYAVTTGDITGADDLYLQNGGGATIQRLSDSNTTYTGVYIAETDRLLIKRTAGATDSVVKSITVKPYISTISDGTLYQMIAGGSLGSELVTNGGFDTDSDWTKTAGVTISGGTYNTHGTTSGELGRQTGLGLVLGDAYLIGWEIPSVSGGSLSVKIGAGSSEFNSSAGVYSAVWDDAAVDNIQLGSTSSAVGAFDNISIKALPESIILYNVESTDWT